MASYLGTGMVADAFNLAFRLPNLFRTIFAEGAFGSSFIPIFTERLTKESKKSALLFSAHAASFLAAILIMLSIIFEIFMPSVIKIIAPGFTHSAEKTHLVIDFARITFPYLFFVSMTFLIASVSNGLGRFGMGAALPILLNLSMIAGIILGTFFEVNIGYTLSVSVAFAGILQLTIALIFHRKSEILYIVKPEYNSDIKNLLKRITPSLLGSGITQINLWISTIIATNIEGAVSIIYYAERLNQFPLAIIGTAIGIVILPRLSQYLASKKIENAYRLANHSVLTGLLLAIPCMVGLASISLLIVELLFEHGQFNVQDSLNVAHTLEILVTGLPAFVLVKILTPIFFASQDTKTPVIISCVSLMVNITVSLLAIETYRFLGIAFANSLSSWINVFLLYTVLHHRSLFRLSHEFCIKLLKIITSAVIMAITLAVGSYYFAETPRFFLVLLLVILGSISYAVPVLAFKVINIKDLFKKHET